MDKKLKNYLLYIKDINFADMTENEKNSLRTEMMVQIGFFQHERLIHLLVTLAFAVFAMISFFGCMAWPGISTYLLLGLLLILLIPYIRHYFILENGVQKLYEYYNMIIE